MSHARAASAAHHDHPDQQAWWAAGCVRTANYLQDVYCDWPYSLVCVLPPSPPPLFNVAFCTSISIEIILYNHTYKQPRAAARWRCPLTARSRSASLWVLNSGHEPVITIVRCHVRYVFHLPCTLFETHEWTKTNTPHATTHPIFNSGQRARPHTPHTATHATHSPHTRSTRDIPRRLRHPPTPHAHTPHRQRTTHATLRHY